ncbi:hypothetical protein [Anaerococcus lactolyticus]|uniref:hypothetical protein n=1 Tax=Anaerococcus lactolyticus TaxID=33032 RepID=UPI0023F3C485|nr:hypothetical protein [Anaerococcus lactolyticus]
MADVKKLVKDFEYFRTRYDLWNIYSDFLEMFAIAISNSVKKIAEPIKYVERESQYLNLVKKYKKEDLSKFAKIFADFIYMQDESIRKGDGAQDILGSLLMELELGSKWNGQFFTPGCMANLLGIIALDEDRVAKEIKKDGFIMASDPAVGGGVTIIGLINAMMDKGFNPQRQLFVDCGDLDRRACYMTYIQLATLGIPAIVKNQDTLLNKVFDVWFTPAFYLDGWWFRLKDFRAKDEGEKIAKSKEIIAKREDSQEEVEIACKEDEQLSMF